MRFFVFPLDVLASPPASGSLLCSLSSASSPLTSASGRDSPENGKNKCLLHNKDLLLFYKLLSVFYQVHYLITRHLYDEALHSWTVLSERGEEQSGQRGKVSV